MRLKHKLSIVAALLATVFAAVSALAESTLIGHSLPTCVPQREAVSVPLPGFASPAEIARPPALMPMRGLLLLFPGSDLADMDGAVVGSDDQIVSRPMQQVADRLACAGFASLRYNKRWVTSSTTVDRDKFDKLNGADLAADGRVALAFARSQSDLARLSVGLVGWSEGTTVAMAVAASEPSVRAVVLMAPVVKSPAQVAQEQYSRIGRPYLAHYVKDGALDADAIAKAGAGPGGVLAHIFVAMFRGFRPGERVNSLLDKNKDGRITFAEADPIIASWYADTLDSGLGMSATGRALPGLVQAYGSNTPPLLILQGLNDSMIAPAAALAFAARSENRTRVTLITYQGLGHSLGLAKMPEEDGLLPVAAKPLDDMATWIQRQLR